MGRKSSRVSPWAKILTGPPDACSLPCWVRTVGKVVWNCVTASGLFLRAKVVGALVAHAVCTARGRGHSNMPTPLGAPQLIRRVSAHSPQSRGGPAVFL